MKNMFLIALLCAGIVLPGCMPCCKRKAEKNEYKDTKKCDCKGACKCKRSVKKEQATVKAKKHKTDTKKTVKPKATAKKATARKVSDSKKVEKHAHIVLEKADNLLV